MRTVAGSGNEAVKRDEKQRAQSARHSAVRRLIENHQEEWDEIHNEERQKRGLYVVTSLKHAREQVRKLQNELEALKAGRG